MSQPLPFTQQPDAIKAVVLRDLNQRTKGGIYIYPATWLITMLWAKAPQTQPIFFIAGTVAFIVMASLRYAVLRACESSTSTLSHNTKYYALMFIVLSSAFMWGNLSAYVILFADFGFINQFYMILAPAFAIGGAAALSISKTMRSLYPSFIFAPPLLFGMIVDYQNYLLMTAMVALAMIYILDISKATHRDYWQAVDSAYMAKERALRLEQLTQTDPLTLIPNRLFFNSELQRVMRLCQQQRKPLSVLMIDIDHFKRINDTYGHLNGDLCLKQVAHILTQTLADTDGSVSRYGGEEFIALLPYCSSQNASEVAQRMINACHTQPILLDQTSVTLSCSIGIASHMPTTASAADQVLRAADKALYAAKQDGRNCWQQARVQPSLTSVG